MANMRATMDKVADPRRFDAAVDDKNDLFLYIIGIIVIVTAVSVFHVWSRVKVMDLNLKMPARIENLAKGELGMSLPTEQQVVQVK